MPHMSHLTGAPSPKSWDSATAMLCEIANTARRPSSRLRRMLYRYERNAEFFDDLIQEAMVRALRGVRALRDHAVIEEWFAGILLNVARQHVKAQSRRAWQSTSLDALIDDAPEPDGVRSECESAETERAVALSRFLANVDSSLNNFPPALRTTFLHVCVDGGSYDEVAAELNVPVGTIRSRVNRARKMLRDQMGSHAAFW